MHSITNYKTVVGGIYYSVDCVRLSIFFFLVNKI